MRQRVMIAMALVCRPQLLIADEPTTALDVTIQAQILELLLSLQQRLNLSIILITHDFGVVAEVAETVAVMHGGKIVETGPVSDIFHNSQHPYTKGLLAAIPKLGSSRGRTPSHA
jgi:ABC-type dipeptide/oligopeptide/nickel transport system ATPase component